MVDLERLLNFDVNARFCRKCGSVLGIDITWLMENVFQLEPRYTINVEWQALLTLNYVHADSVRIATNVERLRPGQDQSEAREVDEELWAEV